jgi:hypothetical protein
LLIALDVAAGDVKSLYVKCMVFIIDDSETSNTAKQEKSFIRRENICLKWTQVGNIHVDQTKSLSIVADW